MTFSRLTTIAVLTALACTGCVDRAPAPAPTQAAPVAATTATGELHELMPSPMGSEAFPLATGSFVTGSLNVRKAGEISTFAIQIGNYNGTSDGAVSIELCQDSTCANGTKPLVGSIDNEYLEIALDRGLDIAAGKALTYRFTKLDGANQVALWLYEPTESVGAVKVNDQTDLTRAPKIAIRY